MQLALLYHNAGQRMGVFYMLGSCNWRLPSGAVLAACMYQQAQIYSGLRKGLQDGRARLWRMVGDRHSVERYR
nr:MAG TPA: hypothetical protein [Caudoviricetes sp.]